jgi:UDP-N-acetylglucosamine 1-carboxyvinyltransferase
MAAATAGDVYIDNVIPKHLESVTAKLREIGAEVTEKDDSIHIVGKSEYNAVDVKTLPYPGFPTDLQQPFSVLLTKADGMSTITETIFTSRFSHVHELVRMGAEARVEGRNAIFEGSRKLRGSRVMAMDLRGGAALVVAALMAEGTTEIREVYHIDRGYEGLEYKLNALGANIWRVFE